ncbi:hypothetical protein JKP88DRAFT_241513 [Tribonema minus]|uniref:Uncharacterized protein n=1 Tax=Tribonema minus TaxID=303371 RepID=A0A835YUG8_9STRA|nr:hypothetical protein JKP88DRAFT_241513 [Tribonema minus]
MYVQQKQVLGVMFAGLIALSLRLPPVAAIEVGVDPTGVVSDVVGFVLEAFKNSPPDPQKPYAGLPIYSAIDKFCLDGGFKTHYWYDELGQHQLCSIEGTDKFNAYMENSPSTGSWMDWTESLFIRRAALMATNLVTGQGSRSTILATGVRLSATFWRWARGRAELRAAGGVSASIIMKMRRLRMTLTNMRLRSHMCHSPPPYFFGSYTVSDGSLQNQRCINDFSDTNALGSVCDADWDMQNQMSVFFTEDPAGQWERDYDTPYFRIHTERQGNTVCLTATGRGSYTSFLTCNGCMEQLWYVPRAYVGTAQSP